MTTEILTVGRIMAREDLDKRVIATKEQAKEECRLALIRNEKRAKEIIKSPIGFTL